MTSKSSPELSRSENPPDQRDTPSRPTPGAFDPTSPGSQLLSRPGRDRSPSLASPEDPFHSSAASETVSPPPVSPSLSSSVRGPIERSDRLGQSMLVDRGAQRSFAGGANQSFMGLINALSLGEVEDEEEDEASADEVGSHIKRPPRRRLSMLPPLPISDDETDDGREQLNSGDEEGDAESSSDTSSDDSEPPSFLSPASQSLEHSAPSPTLAPPLPSPLLSRQGSKLSSKGSISRASRRRQSNASHMSSSIIAIHKPLDDRRRERGDSLSAVPQEQEGLSQMDATALKRAQLAEKLADIFGLETQEQVIAEYQCWLFRSVLLQGFLYLTTGHICFYAYLPRKEGAVLRSERLMTRSHRTRRYYRHWFILKDDVLSWYPSSTDPYFPNGTIDLHYCVSVEASRTHPTHFKVATAEKRWHFSAGSEVSRDEWVKLLKKVVFRCQNEGESVKISLPLETIVDIERSSNLEFAETIRIRVYDADEGFSLDEYWLSYFSDLDGALAEMLKLLDDFRQRNPTAGKAPSTSNESSAAHSRDPSTSTIAPSGPAHSTSAGSGWSTSLSSRLRLFSGSSERASQSVATLTEKDPSGIRTPRSQGLDTSISGLRMTEMEHEHTYPPDPSPGEPPSDLAASDPSKRSTWQVVPSISSIATSVPEWLRGSSRLLHTPSRHSGKAIGRRISEVVSRSATNPSANQQHSHENRMDEDQEEDETDHSEAKVNEKFRKVFGVSEKEHVTDCESCVGRVSADKLIRCLY